MKKTRLFDLAIFNITLIVISIVISGFSAYYYYLRNNYIMFFLCLIVVFHPLLIIITEKIVKKGLLEITKFPYYFFILSSVVLGVLVDLYDLTTWYDNIVHFTSGILMALIAVLIYHYYNQKNNNAIFFFTLFVIIFAAGISSFWEICELFSDTIFHTTVQKGLWDTISDMMLAIIGSVLFTIIYLIYNKKAIITKLKVI